MQGLKDPADKAAFVRRLIEDEVPQLRVLAHRIRGLRLTELRKGDVGVDGLFAIYHALAKKSGSPDKGAGVLLEVETNLDKLDQLVESLEESTIKLELTVVAGIEKTLEELSGWFRKLEAKLSGIHATIDANLDNALRGIEQSYANQAKAWCFWTGVIICMALNADSVSIYKALREDAALTQDVISQRDVLTKDPQLASRAAELNAVVAGAESLNRLVASGATSRPAEFKRQFHKLKTGFDVLSKALARDVKALAENPGLQGVIDVNGESARAAMEEAQTEVDAEEWSTAVRTTDRGMGLISADYLGLEVNKVKARAGLLVDSNLPLGWGAGRFTAVFDGPFWSAVCTILLKALGLLLTALMISMGAPFWNDVLKSLLGVKGFLGKRRDKPEESGG